mmetsp:Transcript_12423/g.18646  ORF Transcript_12423/g.18646 Transcript_12423/m.18646 type:complete len:108 (+) Transcript_12423:60-383(+)
MSFSDEIYEGKKQSQSDKHKLTGKYDMAMLREIAKIEENAVEELVELYKVESEDDLPFDFDIHELMDIDRPKRRSFLEERLKDCPSSAEGFMEKYLEKIKTMNPRLS